MILRASHFAAAGLISVAAIYPLCLHARGGAVSPNRVSAATIVLQEADTARARLSIQGMTCASCATTARVALERSDGVYRAEVSYDSASALVDYDPGRTAPPEFIAALKELTGYDAAVVGEPSRRESP